MLELNQRLRFCRPAQVPLYERNLNLEPGVGNEPTFTVTSGFPIKLSRLKLEPIEGIEPPYQLYESRVIPLYDTGKSKDWWPQWDLNPHGLLQRILSPSRLPVPPCSQKMVSVEGFEPPRISPIVLETIAATSYATLTCLVKLPH